MSSANHCCCLVVAAFAVVAASAASAHVTLENREAAIGRSYKAVFQVPHGCSGSATTKLRVQIPQGVIAVKPMPKPGWNVEAIKNASAYDFHGARLSEGVTEVVWSGGKLPDDFYDEFVISVFLTDALKPNTTLYFPVVQECEQGVSRWIDIPADGGASHAQDSVAQGSVARDSKSPAPGVKLMPKP
jgi:periplasmic copper chaperone A